MTTIAGFLTFIRMINTTSESQKTRKVFIFYHFSFYEQQNFHAQLSWAWTKFYNLGPGLLVQMYARQYLLSESRDDLDLGERLGESCVFSEI